MHRQQLWSNQLTRLADDLERVPSTLLNSGWPIDSDDNCAYPGLDACDLTEIGDYHGKTH